MTKRTAKIAAQKAKTIAKSPIIAKPIARRKRTKKPEQHNDERRRQKLEKNLKKELFGESAPMTRMSCELTSQADHSPRKWPKTSLYVSINTNAIGTDLELPVLEAIHQGRSSRNRFCCDCHDRGEDCATNVNCQCRKIGERLQRKNWGGVLSTEEVVQPTREGDFHYKTFVSCGPLCSCHGNCNLGVLEQLKDNSHLHVKRNGPKGFALFTDRAVKKGQPVVSFIGELCGVNTATSVTASSWSLLLSRDEGNGVDGIFVDTLFKASGLKDEKYKTVLKDAFDCPTFINPLEKGNCARFMSHSCIPNLQPRRVVSNGLSPSDFTIVFFAKRAIKAGEELTFCYGEDYLTDHMANGCLCEKCCIKQTKKRSASTSTQKTSAAPIRKMSERTSTRKTSAVPIKKVSATSKIQKTTVTSIKKRSASTSTQKTSAAPVRKMSERTSTRKTAAVPIKKVSATSKITAVTSIKKRSASTSTQKTSAAPVRKMSERTSTRKTSAVQIKKVSATTTIQKTTVTSIKKRSASTSAQKASAASTKKMSGTTSTRKTSALPIKKRSASTSTQKTSATPIRKMSERTSARKTAAVPIKKVSATNSIQKTTVTSIKKRSASTSAQKTSAAPIRKMSERTSTRKAAKQGTSCSTSCSPTLTNSPLAMAAAQEDGNSPISSRLRSSSTAKMSIQTKSSNTRKFPKLT